MKELVTMKSVEGLYVACKQIDYNGRRSIKHDRLIFNGEDIDM